MRLTTSRLRLGRRVLSFAGGLALASLCLLGAEHAPRRLAATASAASTFTVNSTGDGADSNTADGVCNDGAGNCTLRAAIQQANATTGTDTIAFQITGAGVRTITPATALPTVTDPVIIDGYTQPGASANTLPDGDNAVLLVELSGAGIDTSHGVGASGLTISAGSSTVRGLVINRFSLGGGLSLTTAGNNVVEGNFLGTDAAGSAAAGNGNGVRVTNSSNNQIGGTSPASRNVISGNGNGIFFEQSSNTNQVQGNFIGTDASGKTKLGNGSHGLFVGTNGNTVGGTAAGARNVISGNGQAGVFIQPGLSSPGNTVAGNFIGTDVTGTEAVGNSFVGVWINFGANGTVGGSAATAGNVISGNAASGVLLTGDLSRNNQIAGNLIGTDASGVRPLGNGRHGIEMPDFAHDNFIQQQGPGARPNVIAFNAEDGIRLLAPGTGNTIRLNNIFSNGKLGIDLNGDGVTPNDVGDADGGANNSQNFPVITSVSSSGGTTTVQGTFSGKPSTIYGFDFFTNAACDPSGNGEGARFFASSGTMTDASGNSNFSITLPQPLPAGRVLTATASANSVPRDTSEFSPCSAAGAAGQVEFSSATYNFIEDIGDAVITVNRTGGSAGPLSVDFATTTGSATAGSDYTAASGTLTFADGETTKTFAVHVVNDGATEPDETVGLVLFNATDPDVVGPRGRALLNIVDSSKQPALAFTAATSSIREGLSGTGLAAYTVGLSAATGRTVSVQFQTSDGTATAGQDYQAASATLVFSPGETTKTVTVAVNGDTVDEPNEDFFVSLINPVNATVAGGPVEVTIVNNDTPVLQFGAASFRAGEGDHAFAVTVVRSGLKTGDLAIDYATTDGTASERSDYTTALGTLRFAPGEASKTFTVLLTDDAFQEPDETVNLALTNPTGGAVLAGQSAATLTIADNDAPPPPANPVDDPQSYVRQHYHDFLNREPDASGLQFWTDNITQCGADAQCVQVKRVNVSAAFFLSIEFQETGYLVYRLHQAAFDTGETLRLRTFLADTQEIGRGVVVGAPGWEQQLEQNKQEFVRRFVSRPEFAAAFPVSLSPDQFVDRLNSHTLDPLQPSAGGALTQAERDQLVSDLAAGRKGRAEVLRAVAENAEFQRRQFNKAFVLMQYFGYLRRNPNDAPDADFTGYNFWLGKLNQFHGNFVQAEMVKAFIVSTEYRSRF